MPSDSDTGLKPSRVSLDSYTYYKYIIISFTKFPGTQSQGNYGIANYEYIVMLKERGGVDFEEGEE